MSKLITKTLRLPDGRRKYFRGKTEAEVDKKIAEMKAELLLGVDVCNEITVEKYVDVWLRNVKLPGVSDRTAVRTRSLLDNHLVKQFGAVKVRDIRATHIHSLMAGMTSLSKGTQSAVISLLRAVFNSAVDDNIILRSPVPLTLKPNSDKVKDKVALTPEQEIELLAATEGTPLHVFVFIALESGLRPGEVRGLMWDDLLFDRRLIHVHRHVVDGGGRPVLSEGTKTASGVRLTPMSDRLAEFLLDLRSKSSSVYVCPDEDGCLWAQRSFSSAWERVSKQLSFHVHAHMLRHTFVTKLVRAGVDMEQISAVVGHKDSTVTRTVYAHYNEELRKSGAADAVRAELNRRRCTSVALSNEG